MINLLDEEVIKQALSLKGFTKPYSLHLFKSIDSTNRFLKDLNPSPELSLCCAEEQTQGRGRFNRPWHSPFGENIYFSSRWALFSDITKLSGLSLVVSLAVLATIKDEADIKVKWPNDLYWQDKKLCGILIEVVDSQIIIGIGLNVNSTSADNSWCSLYEITKQYHNRNQLIANLLINLEKYLTRFKLNGLSGFMEEWVQFDYLAGKSISLKQNQRILTGRVQGLTEKGQLILEDENGALHFLSSGDTSLSSFLGH